MTGRRRGSDELSPPECLRWGEFQIIGFERGVNQTRGSKRFRLSAAILRTARAGPHPLAVFYGRGARAALRLRRTVGIAIQAIARRDADC
jgi:hypothetical protein